MKLKYLLPLFALLTLTGAGCLPGSQDSMMESDSTDDSMMMDDAMGKDGDEMTKDDEKTIGDEDDDSMMMDESAMVEIDDTWETYHNDALGFGFMWPTRGRYAPTWEIIYPNADEIEDGCYATNAEDDSRGSQTNAQGITFCTDSLLEDGIEKNIYKHFFTTKKDHLNIVLKTEKSTVDSVAFSENDYQTVLNTMIGSFSFDEE